MSQAMAGLGHQTVWQPQLWAGASRPTAQPLGARPAGALSCSVSGSLDCAISLAEHMLSLSHATCLHSPTVN